MPHLRFETTVDLVPAEKREFADDVTELYAERMETGTGHVAVTIRALEDGEFFLGRLEPDAAAVMLNADVRAGRTDEQKRSFVLGAFDVAHERWNVPTENMYAVLTEHAGEEFHEYGRTLSSWVGDEAEEGTD